MGAFAVSMGSRTNRIARYFGDFMGVFRRDNSTADCSDFWGIGKGQNGAGTCKSPALAALQ